MNTLLRYGAPAVILCAIISLVTAAGISAQAVSEKPTEAPLTPRVIAYEGYCTDADGAPVPTGTYNLTFSLYAGPSGGTPLWSEYHRKVDIVNGIIRVHLGRGATATPLDLPFDQPYFLGIQIGDEPELAPRLELTTSAYSFRAIMADDVRDGSISTRKLAPLSVTDDKIQSVSWNKIIGAPGSESLPILTKPGAVPASVWHITGNTKTDSVSNYLGTADKVGLMFRTDNIDRMTIASTGKVSIKSDLDVEGYVTSRVSPTEGGFLLADPQHGLKRVGNDDVRMFTTNGNLLLEGGNVGIGTATPAAKLHVGGTVKIVSNLAGADNTIDSYPVQIDAKDQGMAITLDGLADSDQNYISFWDDYGVKGRIEGQSIGDKFSDPEWIANNAIDLVEIAVASSELVGAGASAHGCVGLGACVAPPIPSLIAAGAISLAAQAGRFLITNAFHFDNIGVGYESGSADYAEWLERLSGDEALAPGDIVGVFGGKITRTTRNAQQYLVISRAPIVLGNMPENGEEHRYEKVAFMGQVQVKVRGAVREGDYIIPSGLEDGTGIAVSPALMTADEYATVIGRAWESSGQATVKHINVAVGLNPGDVANIVRDQQTAISSLKNELEQLRAQITAMAGLSEEVARLREAMIRNERPVPSQSLTASNGAGRDNAVVKTSH